jgi:hypothetical protein
MANLIDYNLTGFKDLSSEVDVSYSCKIPAFAVRAGEEVLAFKLPTIDFSAWDVGAQERTLPFSRPGNFYGKKNISIEIPDGYEIEFLPEGVDVDVGYESFEGELKFENGKINYYQTTSGEHRRIIEPDEYTEYKQFVEQKSKFADKWILVRKK